MIKNQNEYKVTLNRIETFEAIVKSIKEKEPNKQNRILASRGFKSEIEKMRKEVKLYLQTQDL